MLDSFKKNTDGDRRLVAHCNRCGHTTIHRVVVEYEGKWDDGEGYFGGEEHRILRCGGCDSVKYSVSSWDSQDWDEDEDGAAIFRRTTKFFPPIQVRSLDTDYTFNIPLRILHVLTETLDAQSNNNLILATVGLRILIETVCDAADCKAGTLEKKIDRLETKGLVSTDEKDLFHKVRAFGNKGAHLGQAMDAEQIASGLDISTHLLEKLFVDPARKKSIFDKAKVNLDPSD